MGQLSAQSIEALCKSSRLFGFRKQQPMIVPFSPDKVVVRGRSKGLSASSYDVSIAHDLELGVNPSWIVEAHIKSGRSLKGDHLDALRMKLKRNPPQHALAHTVEDFFMPHDVVGYVCDKSTYARLFVTAFNTLFDPGFCGNATLELVNLGNKPISLKKGDPIAQFVFHWLDKKTDRPYTGKYQNQTKAAHPARFEET
jgi:deoxycytidine triphosphate deaminase